jgi:hypothetical protein
MKAELLNQDSLCLGAPHGDVEPDEAVVSLPQAMQFTKVTSPDP